VSAAPPETVRQAAAQVQQWLDGRQTPPQQPGVKVSDEQFAKMSARERIDYTRQFDQSQFQTKAAPR
jgi:hypothetical protein